MDHLNVDELFAKLDARRAPQAAPAPERIVATTDLKPLVTRPKWLNLQTIAIAAMGLVLVWALFFRGVGNAPVPPGPGPAPGPANELTLALKQIMVGPDAKEDSEYLSTLCDGVAVRLSSDWSSGNHQNTRTEAAETIGQVGYFATNGILGGKYRGLDGVINKHFSDTWESEGDQLKAGKLTSNDKTSFLRKWNELRDAFKQIK